MVFRGSKSKKSRVGRALAVMVAFSAAVLAAPMSATAEGPPSPTPETAIVVTELPYQSQFTSRGDPQPATSELALKISHACNADVPIYPLGWWKVAPTTPSTFVAHSLGETFGLSTDPFGSAVLSADLGTVLECGTSGESRTRTGALTASADAPVFIAMFDRHPWPGVLTVPSLALIPSTGIAPGNDTPDTAKVISSIPSQVTQDSTLAAEGPLPCYSNVGFGPPLWYSWTADKTDLIDLQMSGYGVQSMAVIPVVNGVRQEPICDGQRFSAEVGTTYLIGVAGYGQTLQNIGSLTVAFSYAPPAPELTLSITSTGSVNKKTGVATIRGQVTCAGYGFTATEGITGTLTQTNKRVIGQSMFSVPEVPCTGAPVPWSATAEPTNLVYGPGAAEVTATLTVCNNRGCTTADAQATVTLNRTR